MNWQGVKEEQTLLLCLNSGSASFEEPGLCGLWRPCQHMWRSSIQSISWLRHQMFPLVPVRHYLRERVRVRLSSCLSYRRSWFSFLSSSIGRKIKWMEKPSIIKTRLRSLVRLISGLTNRFSIIYQSSKWTWHIVLTTIILFKYPFFFSCSSPPFPIQTRPMYCRVNMAIPVLDRFFNERDPRQDCRLSRESLAVLLNLLQQDQRHGWGATIETLVFLFWLASGASYRGVSRVFGMPHSTGHRIVHRVTAEVVSIGHKVFHFSQTAEDLVAVIHGFAGLARHRAFLKPAGAIGGCHVRNKLPSGLDGHCYRRRKLFVSINLQAVCDYQSHVVDTYVGWLGLVHDSRVLLHSPLYRRAI